MSRVFVLSAEVDVRYALIVEVSTNSDPCVPTLCGGITVNTSGPFGPLSFGGRPMCTRTAFSPSGFWFNFTGALQKPCCAIGWMNFYMARPLLARSKAYVLLARLGPDRVGMGHRASV